VEQEELMAFLDGEVAADRAVTIAGHLKGCVECAALAEDFRKVSRRMAEWEVEAGNVGVIAEAPKRVWRWRTPVWVAGLAAAGLAAVFLVTEKSSPRFVGDVVTTSRPRLLASRTAEVQGQQGMYLDSASQAPQLRATDYGTRLKATFSGPMIARTAQLTLVAADFAHTRERLDAILKAHHGYVGQLTVNAPAGAGRTLDAALKVPSAELDASLAEMKKLGRVESESQAGEEVTQQYVDLEARLANARNTEQRLTAVLRQHTDKMTDVLAVEREIARVRGEIERMEAERKGLSARVQFATIVVKVTEEYKAQLQGPESVGTRLGNAAVAGYRHVTGGVMGAAEWALEYGFSIVLWMVVLFFPARFAWKRYRA
jgi:anti-sigma factor RsiW